MNQNKNKGNLTGKYDPLISVIIPTYNRKTKLARLLNSILESTYPKDKMEIIVVDDASTDGTKNFIEQKFSDVIIIRNQNELFVSESRNIGIKHATGEFIFLIDDDNVVDKMCMNELTKILQSNQKIGFVGPIMYYFSEKNKIAWAGAKRGKFTSLTKILKNHPTKPITETEYIPNALMVRKRVAEEIGLYDNKNFPFLYDDGDFCQRGKKKGYEIVVTSKAKVWHDIPLEENTVDKTRIYHCNTEKKAYFNSRNRILFQHKHTSKNQFLIFLLLFNWVVALYYLKIIINSKKSTKEKIGIIKSYWKGIFAGIKLTLQE